MEHCGLGVPGCTAFDVRSSLFWRLVIGVYAPGDIMSSADRAPMLGDRPFAFQCQAGGQRSGRFSSNYQVELSVLFS